MTTSLITIKGAREHNLRNVNLKLPRGKLICFTGVSGSGKSSLAFDTLYAEGQRRYVESLSNYARQFMGQMPKPDVDFISGLSPSISISQKSTGANPRSTVGTITEIQDFLRVLYARVGTAHCPECGNEVAAQTREQIIGRILERFDSESVAVLAPLARAQKGEFRDLFEDLRKQGFARGRVDGAIFRLEEPPSLDRNRRHDVDVVIDRLTVDKTNRGRLAEAIDNAMRLGDGMLSIASLGGGDDTAADSAASPEMLFSSQYACADCGISFSAPSPQLFSFNSPQGMCPGCDGLGKLYTFVPELLVPDPSLSFKKGAIALIGNWSSLGKYKRHIYSGVAESVERQWELEPGTMLNTPWKDLTPELCDAWLWGTGSLHITFTWKGSGKSAKYGGEFSGVVADLVERYRTAKNKMYLRAMEKYMDTLPCPDCAGQRLNRQARAVTLQARLATKSPATQLSLPQLCELPANRLAEFIDAIELNESQQFIAAEVLKEVRTRVGFLLGVGLDYLSLSRTAPTLSGGESQRIRLAGQIGSGLAGVLYILDEPSIGLHARDNDRLIETLLTLRDRGNTLIVVEHDEDTMRAADMVVDFGPGPGSRGGKVVASGSLDDVAKTSRSLTGKFLSGAESIDVPAVRRSGNGLSLTIHGAEHHNLKEVDVEIPLGRFVCVTGVSGSGKSSLIGDVLEPALRRVLNGAECQAGAHDYISGIEHLDKTIAIDQSPIGRTPRSNPATYVKVFDEIRALFAKLPEAKTRGFTASRFSFNVEGGRCSACDGNGSTKLDMDFLADVWVPCPVCEGHRYNRETLAVKFKEHSISDVLELEIGQALKLFDKIPAIADRLQTLVDVGLEYLQLGQPSPTLSGGEAQRIKLSRELSRKSTGKTLYVLDEPTTGLHFADIKLLLAVLGNLVDMGNTIVVVEHNLDVIKMADWVIDLGPEGGEGGGQIVFAGTPEDLIECEASHTGQALRRVMPGVQRKSQATKKRSTNVSAKTKTNGTVDRRRLVVEGASQHNLKAVDVSIPRDAMTVFCGPSGSGKSSLAMDTIYAEGQRRYVESLSSYARQFIGQTQKPRVERIEGLSPAVALEQKNLGHSPRSTVGTVTEIHDYLRILLARLGEMYCPTCDIPVGTQTVDQIVDKVMSMPAETRVLLLAPLERSSSQSQDEFWASLRGNGFTRARVDGVTHRLEEMPNLDDKRYYEFQLVIDRVVIRPDDRRRVAESAELALAMGKGVMQLAIVTDDRDEPKWQLITHSQHLACDSCGASFQLLTPHHFSFNTAVGWCRACEGLGTQFGTNPAALLRGGNLSLLDGALLPWPSLQTKQSRAMLVALARHADLPLDCALDDMTTRQRRFLFQGTGDDWIEVRESDYARAGELFSEPASDPQTPELIYSFQFKGLYPAVADAARLSAAARSRLRSFTAEVTCPVCDGSRLNSVAAAVRFQGLTIADYTRMPLAKLSDAVSKWKLDARQKKIAGELTREIKSRVQFLLDVGLDYLNLGRPAVTLSGGEAQRIRLAAQLGSGLCGVLYVLDEPTIGLHPRDNERLLGALHRLRDLGNTLLVVEHDQDVIEGSDYLCDFGPRAGSLGGRIVAQGPPNRVQPAAESVTAPYLKGQKGIAVPTNRRIPHGAKPVETLTILQAAEHNLKEIDVEIPLGVLTAVTGPSGSGKSTLINDVLYPALGRLFHAQSGRQGKHAGLKMSRRVDKVIQVDQTPLGNTPASTPATYTGVFDLIRTLFAQLPTAKARGYTARQFSFNVPGGRCEACEGTGRKKIEMHFLPDVWITCEDCDGHRYHRETLEVRYHGKSIADVLEMSCADALRLFEAQPKITRILQTLVDVGLDYLALGQSAPTLSGGEAQRVKLAAELSRPDTGNTIYLLDEPTTGLHFDDIVKLLDVLHRLVDLGNSVVVIEHNLDVIKTADWVIDMGPEAGAAGGLVVCAGTPEEIVEYAQQAKSRKSQRVRAGVVPRSYTGEYLRQTLAKGPHEVRQAINREDYLREQIQQHQTPLAVQSNTQPPWTVDGRQWHLEAPKDRKGESVLWDVKCIRNLIATFERDGRFAKINFNHFSTIEVTGANLSEERQVRGSGEFCGKQWFAHVFSSESKWMKVKFRVPPGTFLKGALLKELKLPTLDALNIPGLYSPEARVRMVLRKDFQEIEFRFVRPDELETKEFQQFLGKAIDAYLPDDAIGVSGDLKKPAIKNGKSVRSDQTKGSRGRSAIEQPWLLLGRAWHATNKGFPSGNGPQWPIKLAESLMQRLESVVGSAPFAFDHAEYVTLEAAEMESPFGRILTKHPQALVLELQGEAATMQELMRDPAFSNWNLVSEIDEEEQSVIQLHFTNAAEVDSPELGTALEKYFGHILQP